MRSLRSWTRKYRDKRKPSKDVASSSHLPPLPSLPAPSDLLLAPPRARPQAQSPFFRLPAELRYRILREAFGNRTVHVDLAFRPPLFNHDTSGGRGPLHGGYPPQAYFPGPRGASAWRWYSCVCHHNAPPGVPEIEVPLFFDDCLSGMGRTCHLWPGSLPDKCQVGITGLLLSCKQGYADASDVMYSTNTINVQGAALTDGLLQQYLVPSAPILTGPDMRRITSLVLTWDLTLFGRHDGTDEAEQRTLFAQRLDLLPRAFPELARLRLILKENTYDRAEVWARHYVEEVVAVLFEPISDACRKLGRLRDFGVLLTTSLFDHIPLKAERECNPRVRKERYWTEKVWYPFTAGPEERQRPGEGYWISRGPQSNLDWRHDGTPFLHSHQPAHAFYAI